MAALQVAALVIEQKHPLSALAATAMERVPQVLQNCNFKVRLPIEKMAAMGAESKKIEAELGERGRVLVRWSGTEPKLRVMIEGEDEKRILELAGAIIDAAKKDIAAHEGSLS